MTYSKSAGTAATKMAKTVADEGWSVVGALDGAVSRRLLRAVDEVAARSPDTIASGQLHQLPGLAQHPDLAAVVDWPPLLELVVELLSPNVYINHSHLDVHPPHPPTGAHRWHRDNGLMSRDMRLLWRDQPRVTLKVAVYLTDVESPDDGALEMVPRSHLDTASRYPTEEQPEGVPILGPAGTVAVFDARLWHRRRDNLGTRIRRAMFMAYSYRWLTSRDVPFENVPEWVRLPPIRRQLLGDKTVDPFYWASGELALDPRSTGFSSQSVTANRKRPAPQPEPSQPPPQQALARDRCVVPAAPPTCPTASQRTFLIDEETARHPESPTAVNPNEHNAALSELALSNPLLPELSPETGLAL